MKTTVEIDNTKVKEVKIVWDDNEANELLANGWTYLHGGCAHQDQLGYRAKPVFILGRVSEE